MKSIIRKTFNIAVPKRILLVNSAPILTKLIIK